MDDLQKLTAKAIVNIFETGRVAGNYGAVTILKGDSGHLTYGRSQTTLGSGNLFLLIKAYCERTDAQYSSELKPFLADLSTRNTDLDRNVDLRQALEEAGDDPAMRSEQDRFFDENYFDPACRSAAAKGIQSPLGQTVVYDSVVQGGFTTIASLVGLAIGPGGVDEQQWIQKYVAARKLWLSKLNPPLPATVYRMDAFTDLIGKGAWDLPLNLTVHTVTITPDNLQTPLPIVRASAVDPSDPPPARILQLASPYMQGEDVRQLQVALNANALANDRDGIYGPFTEALVKKFQISKNMRADGVVGPMTRVALGL